jgi:riboflavin kinase/FMN adenylyltransferase
VNIEAHIFRFNENLYNKTIVVEFCKKLRDEKKFSSREDLIAQLKKDAVVARRSFSSKSS